VRILYGVVGEGMGHATRSLVVIEHLLASGHELRIVVSGRAHGFLVERLAGRSHVTIDEIHGLTLTYFGNELGRGESLFDNLRKAPKGIKKNVEVYRTVAEQGFSPEVVISDFESWAALYALNHFLPVISIDNMQIINRAKHKKDLRGAKSFDFNLAKWAVKIKMPKAYHYLITSFFFPPVRKKYTTLVPPILRPAVCGAERVPGDHVLVYQTQTTNQALIDALKKLPHEFRVYGLGVRPAEANVDFRGFSETGFVDDLRTARAVIAGGGFSLMSEAVSLGVPMLSVPVARQYEQELNARYLERLGYGAWATELDGEVMGEFLERTDEYARNLRTFERHDNGMLFGCLDELLGTLAEGRERPVRLESPAMGKWEPEAEAT
jgi:uncharacterized protein (TIGR00661 family)